MRPPASEMLPRSDGVSIATRGASRLGSAEPASATPGAVPGDVPAAVPTGAPAAGVVAGVVVAVGTAEGSTVGWGGAKNAYHPIMTSAESTIARIRLRLLSSIGSPALRHTAPLQSKGRHKVKGKARMPGQAGGPAGASGSGATDDLPP